MATSRAGVSSGRSKWSCFHRLCIDSGDELAAEIQAVEIVLRINGDAVGSEVPIEEWRIFGNVTLVVDSSPLTGFQIHLILIVSADPYLAVHIKTRWRDHSSASGIALSEFRRFPGLEFFRFRIKPGDDTLIHRALPDLAFRVQADVECSPWLLRIHQGHGIFDDLAGLGVEFSEKLRSKIGIPHHSLRIHYCIVRQGLFPRQIVLGYDDLRRLSFGPRQCLQFVIPRRTCRQIDRGRILSGFE